MIGRPWCTSSGGVVTNGCARGYTQPSYTFQTDSRNGGMGIIDTHSEYSLYDVFDGSLGMSDQGRGFTEPEGSIDFYGFHILPANDNGTYIVQYDGHVGQIDRIEADDYDDVLELVDALMRHVFRAHNYDYRDDKEELVEWAGKIMVDEGDERAEERPDLYVEVPNRPNPDD